MSPPGNKGGRARRTGVIPLKFFVAGRRQDAPKCAHPAISECRHERARFE
jgi:hypothetical protein